MPGISTYVIEKNYFVREGFKSLLEKTSYLPLAALDDTEDIYSLKKDDGCTLVIVGVSDCTKDIASCIRCLRSVLPNAHVVLLSEHIDSSMIAASFEAGADGYILKDISAEAFLGYLELIMMGEKVFPTSMASLLVNGWDESRHDPACLGRKHFSGREVDVIECLTEGTSNKVIARQLNITEATVKVHLKSILRKLGLENRTQAAIWAVNNGIESVHHNDIGAASRRAETFEQSQQASV